MKDTSIYNFTTINTLLLDHLEMRSVQRYFLHYKDRNESHSNYYDEIPN